MHKLSWQPVISITATTHVLPDTHTHTEKHTHTTYFHSAMENNTSSETQRYKSLFHSLPATFNFKQVLLVLNMHSLHSASLLEKEMTLTKRCDWIEKRL